MPLDAYSSCPGGTGKKIKFCCSDLLGDLQKIDRMLEGEQFQAALSQIERLAEKHPGRACLMALHCLLLRITHRVEEAESLAAKFVQLHPQNPVALAETAIMTAAKQGGHAAMPWLQRAMEAAGQEIPSRLYEMLTAVGQILAMEGNLLAARAVLQWAVVLVRDDPMPQELLGRINSSRDLPVWVKDERRLVDCPADAPWRAEFDEALQTARRGRWSVAEQRFLAILAQAGDQPAVWRNVAVLRGWLADHAGCVKALRKFSGLDVPLEDAAEAAAVGLFLSEDPLGDRADVLNLTYPIADVDRFQSAVASARQFRPVRVDPASLTEEGDAPPLAVYLVLDRDLPVGDGAIELAKVPRLLCQALYHGRQTDREPRLELHPVAASEQQAVEGVLSQSLPGALGPLAERQVTERMSQTQELLARNWSLPRDVAPEQIAELVRQHHDEAMLNRWPAIPLGILDGKSPQEAAAEPRYRVPLLAAILLVEFWMEQNAARFDFNRLRARLGLPTLDPIDPEQTDVATLPVARLTRVVVEKLPDEGLLRGFRRAMAASDLPALRKFGRALIDRPSFTDRENRLQILSLLARIEDDPERALTYVNAGRKLAEEAGQSSAPWDLMELSFRFAHGDEAEVNRLFHHLNAEHIREPGVASALHNWLVQIGAIGPEGMPAGPAAPPHQAEPSFAVPTEPAAEPGQLWTPGGQQATGEKPKLWMPGMD